MENGPAKKLGVAKLLQSAGETSGDPFEISHIRREVVSFLALFFVKCFLRTIIMSFIFKA